MNLDKLLDTTFTCQCGRSHKVPIRNIIYSEDALVHLPEVLSSLVNGRHIVLVADLRTLDILGRHAREVLEQAGWSVHQIIVPDSSHGSPVCNDTTHNWLNEHFPPADIALAVGSGVINDLTKWSAFEHDLPYAVVATAATMNGYTAANVAPTLKGVKTLITARAPLAVFAVPSVIINAPSELTAAGLGDTIAKPLSSADWLFNNIFCNENFCRYCSEIINSLEPYYFNKPEDIKTRRPAAIEALFNALLYSGIAMTIIGTSAPASGGEHLLSHTLDMMSSLDGVPHDLHGRQVGIGTIFSAALYERIFKIETPKPLSPPSDIDSTFWAGLAENVRDQYDLKKSALKTIYEKLTDAQIWQSFISAARQQVRSPDEIKNCLKTAGAAHTYADIKCSRERLMTAVLHMHEIRKRPTIIDLAWILGILPDSANEIIDTWLTA
ncbi:MAG: iron-containing alcohol dehydrogenase [Planctomycetes bacterium]|nr:iron-containing alcohol dehydrogenase [Planctomycetota bacterium]MBL7142876.1 iron-containing alcohol dehydrogenase [Phycisphaerae bacterium]